jgi:uncharacterized protein (DUF305 family)
LASKIAAAQQPQIDQMSTWRQGHQVIALPDARAERLAYSDANEKMMNGMMGDHAGHSANADSDFVAMMIPHHQGAIDMAQVQLNFGQDAELRSLAENIISSQQSEIQEMTTWLHGHGH